MHRDQPIASEPVEKLLGEIDPVVSRILEGALAGNEITGEEALALFQTRERELEALLLTADALRRATVGDRISFVVTRNINFTNICYTGCRFCAFAKRRDDPEAEFLSLDEIATRAEEAWNRGASEVCIQGGLHPDIDASHYRDILVAIKSRVPGIHIHAFSPFEIKYGAERSRLSVEDFLGMLREHGLDTIPGTAAEILDVEVRRKLTRNKLSAEEWVAIVKTAHRLGIRSSSTIMYGHVDAPEHWVAHLSLLREMQKETGGLTELVPLGFVHWDAPIFLAGEARPGPTDAENLRMHAVARILLNRWIPNLQVSWVKLGPSVAQRILSSGANDFGGTLMNESISRAAGSPHGQEITPLEMCRMIREIGRTPVRRNTLYETLEVYDDHDPAALSPLVPRMTQAEIPVSNR
ncbi:MAG: 5-amino-6-(D-ribitylamino)uracil--L-tyrosine 4-hydroxyphenyl transferase CofH [Acidobacteria bacterium]|nr:5-amino-6-(D-ribitylamino)uracil--L-tyrosine 4-hydroxyphenyl transferase CofH [Acidobacteriota bacterium]